MSETVFSPEQRSAIDTRDRTLLVSAAAGSGKTTTLTERIIESLLDEHAPESISNMLIVTFTKAAVSDMRDKISAALKEAVIKNPENKRIERELYMLPSARICTIDSFCNEILRTNAERIGITPSYRIAESAEAEILSYSLMDMLISAVYEGDMPEICAPLEFEELASCLTDSKATGKLSEVFLLLYKKTTSAIEGVGIFRELVDKFKIKDGAQTEETCFGKDVMDLLSDAVKHYTGIYDRLISGLYSEGEETDRGLYENERDALLIAGEKKTYTEAREALFAITFESHKRISDKSDFQIFARARRDEIKKAVLEFRSKYFSYTDEEWKALYENLYRVLSVLVKFLEKFDTLFLEEKARRGMLEHSDVERFAYRCLYDENGEKTDIAAGYSSLFTSVYIDEYQDVNALQDAIFSAVSTDKNRFMVGDIKQSIYRFRSAKPEIFANMKKSFPPLDKCSSASGASLFMSQNYRCDKGIIDFVNAIFDVAFEITAESIEYVKEDRLKPAKVYKNGEPEYTPGRIVILNKPPKKKKGGEPDAETAPEGDDLWEDIIADEPAIVAKKIKELLDSGELANHERIKPSDIAIILRKNDLIENFSAALSEYGIASETKDTKNFFLNAEVLLALCLLNAIDNPSKDIYLAGLMCSPLYGITPDELVKIRKFGTGGTLYSDVKEYSASHPEEVKISDFLNKLSHYRILSEGMNVDTLIARLYRETGLLALASKHHGKDNLMLLYNYSRKYEGSSYKGLYNFINYINNIIEAEAGFSDEKRGTGDPNAVKIVTVHSSKGLEYPIVFFAGASKKLSNLDKKNRFAYSEDYGLSVYLRAPMGLALARNPIQHIIHNHMDKKYVEEELRVLYVALTRARERIFVVGTSQDSNTDDYLRRMEFEGEMLDAYSLQRSKSFLDIILKALRAEGDIELPDISSDSESDETDESANDTDEWTIPEVEIPSKPDNEERAERIYATLFERFKYEYPHTHHTTLPEKMSVSHLYPKVLDGTEEDAPEARDEIEAAANTEENAERRAILPTFFSGADEDESAKRGIATHTVLQFCDLDKLEKLGTDAELSRLLRDGFITSEDLSRVRRREIEAFRHSELFRRMKDARELYREFRFNSRLPADIFTSETEKKAAFHDTEILVQGVIDCIIVRDDGEITVVDYKTDRLTKEQLSNEEKAREKLFEKHARQLTYYSLAAEKIFGRKVRSVGIYSLPLGKLLEAELFELDGIAEGKGSF